MSIRLSARENEDISMHYYGIKLSKKIVSDGDFLAALSNHHRDRKITLMIVSTSLFMLLAVFLFMRPLNPSYFPASPQTARYAGIVLCFSVIASIISLAFLKEMIVRERLYSPLSEHTQLCAELLRLTKISDAVKEYVQTVTGAGRQLRVFDIARANELFDHEQKHLSSIEMKSGESCLDLHAL